MKKHLISNYFTNILRKNNFIKNTLNKNIVKRTLRVCLTVIIGCVSSIFNILKDKKFQVLEIL